MPKHIDEQDSSTKLFEFIERYQGPFSSRKEVMGLANSFGFSHNALQWLSSLLVSHPNSSNSSNGINNSSINSSNHDDNRNTSTTTTLHAHSVNPSDNQIFHWNFNFEGIKKLRDSYTEIDVWSALEPRNSGGVFVNGQDPIKSIDFVYGANSKRWTPELLERLKNCDTLYSTAHHHDHHQYHQRHHSNHIHHPHYKQRVVRVHKLQNAGHWLHADNPNGLLDLFKHFPPREKGDR